MKLAIDQSFQVSLHHSDGLFHTLEDPSDARVSNNLRNLARVAQNFHSSASTSATTIHGANGTSWNVLSDTALSMSGGVGLTVDKRHQIDRYFKSMRGATRRKPLARTPSSAAASVVASPDPVVSSGEAHSNASEISDDNDVGDDEAEFELLFLNGLEEVAKDSMLTHDFAKAETILEKAIQRHTGSSSGDAEFRKLQIQLAMCYFFQHKWRLAEPLITHIAKSKANLDEVVCNLLHALALAHLADYSFDKSITICKQALWGKRRLKRALGATHATECNETLGLLATIYETKGDPMYAEVLRRTIPTGFSYEHPLNELEFIDNHPKLSQDVFGGKITLKLGPSHTIERRLTVIPELPNEKKTSLHEEGVETFYKRCREAKRPLRTLRARIDLYERFDKDTEKEVVVPSIPSAASDSSEEFALSYLSNSTTNTSTSTRPELAPKRSFTKKVARFIGSVRAHPRVSSDGLSVRQTRETPNFHSPLRRKLGKGFWSKSDTNIFTIRKSRTRLLKRARYEAQSETSTMDNRHWVRNWLRSTPADAMKLLTETTDDDPVGLYGANRPSIPEIGGREVHEMMGL